MCPHVKQAVSLKTIMVLHEMEKFELLEASIKIDSPTGNLKKQFYYFLHFSNVPQFSSSSLIPSCPILYRNWYK